MPVRPLAPWTLIALLMAAPVLAQDAAAPEADPEAAPEVPDAAPGAAPDAAPDAVPTLPGEGEAGVPSGGGEAPIGLALGESGEPELGQIYVRDVFTDWELRCERIESGEDPCQLYQLLEDQDGNAVAEISVFDLPEGSAAVAGATIITPLMTLLTEQITLSVDNGQARRYPFSWCSAIGCIARVGFTPDEVQQLRRGNQAQISIVPAAAPDQRVDLGISLSGFTAGLQAAADSGAPPAE